MKPRHVRRIIPILAMITMLCIPVRAANAGPADTEGDTPADGATTQSAPAAIQATADAAGDGEDDAVAGRSLTLHDQRPRTATIDYYAPVDGYGTAVKIGSVTIDGDESITLPTEQQLADMAGDETVLHPDTHAGQGFSGDCDWNFVGWSILTIDDEYSTMQDDGSIVTATDITDPNQETDGLYWKPGKTWTPPTAGTLTSDHPDASDAWWDVHGVFVPVYQPLIRYHANGGGGGMDSTSTTITARNTYTPPSGKEFGGWNTKADKSGTFYPQLTVVSRAPTTLGALDRLYPDTGRDETADVYQPLLLYAVWGFKMWSDAANIRYESVWYERNPPRPENGQDRSWMPEAVAHTIDTKRSDWTCWGVTGTASASDARAFDTTLPTLSDYGAQYSLTNGKYAYVGLSDLIGNEWTLSWNTKPDGSGTAYRPGATFHVPLGQTVLYAQWTPKTPTVVPDVTIRYHANGGSGSMDDTILSLGDVTDIDQNGYTWTTRTFIGWNTKADGSGTAYQPGQSVTATGDLDLYAQWETSLVPADGLPGTGGNASPTAWIVLAGGLAVAAGAAIGVLARRAGREKRS